MNFYDFHIGDYASRTAHLEPMEDLAYRRLLDLYYVREEALPADVQEIARLIRMRDHADTIRAVLAEFFRETPDGWAHDRCEAVITAAVDKRNKARASAAQRWENERNANALPPHTERIAGEVKTHSGRSADAMPTHSEGNAPSPSPTTQSQKKKDSAVALLLSTGISESMAADFLALRRAKKAPMTETALKRIRSEAEKAGMELPAVIEMCCARGWAGFEAKWLADGKAQQPRPLDPPRPTERPQTPEEKRQSDAIAAAALAAMTRPKLVGAAH